MLVREEHKIISLSRANGSAMNVLGALEDDNDGELAEVASSLFLQLVPGAEMPLDEFTYCWQLLQ